MSQPLAGLEAIEKGSVGPEGVEESNGQADKPRLPHGYVKAQKRLIKAVREGMPISRLGDLGNIAYRVRDGKPVRSGSLEKLNQALDQWEEEESATAPHEEDEASAVLAVIEAFSGLSSSGRARVLRILSAR